MSARNKSRAKSDPGNNFSPEVFRSSVESTLERPHLSLEILAKHCQSLPPSFNKSSLTRSSKWSVLNPLCQPPSSFRTRQQALDNSASDNSCPTFHLIHSSSVTNRPLQTDNRTQIHQIPRTAARPSARAAHQSRSQDRIRHLPARVERQGTERGKGIGCGTGSYRCGWKACCV